MKYFPKEDLIKILQASNKEIIDSEDMTKLYEKLGDDMFWPEPEDCINDPHYKNKLRPDILKVLSEEGSIFRW